MTRGSSNKLPWVNAYDGSAAAPRLSIAGWYESSGLVVPLVAAVGDDQVRDRAHGAAVAVG
jgi:hypothetical protein